MSFQRMNKKFVSWVICISLSAMSAVAQSAYAARSLAEELSKEVAEKGKEIKELEKQRRDVRAKINAREADDYDDIGLDFGVCDSNCDPGAGSACDENVYKRLGLDASKLGTGSGTGVPTCVLLYEQARSIEKLRQISLPCAMQVQGCGTIQNKIQVKILEAREKALDNQIVNAKDEQKDLSRDAADAFANCPNCVGGAGAAGFGMGGMMQQRKPGLGDYLVGGLQAITPMFLGGLQAGLSYDLYSQGLGSYNSNYNSYLNGCMTLGVPCQGPMAGGGLGLMGMGMGGLGMGMMGGMGLGMGGMGMMGMGGMGLGMGGMGMMGMGGMGLGMGGGLGFGLNLGIGGGLGMGGMGMMGMGGMGLGMGMNPMMGMGMNPMMGMGMNPMMGMGMNPMMGMGMNPMMGMGMNPMMGMGMNPMMGMGMNPMMGMGMNPMMGMGGMGYGTQMFPAYGNGMMGTMGMMGNPNPMMGYPSVGSGYFNPYMSMGYGNPQYQGMYGSSMQNMMAPMYGMQQQQDVMIAQQQAMQAQQRAQQLMMGGSGYYNPYMGMTGYGGMGGYGMGGYGGYGMSSGFGTMGGGNF
jgi:hypothetical protein